MHYWNLCKTTGRIVLLHLIFLYHPVVIALAQYGYYSKSAFAGTEQPVLISWNTKEGKERLFRSQYNDDFFQLAHHYQPQANPLYCGIASSVMVLNSLRIGKGLIPTQAALEVKKPMVWGGGSIPYNLYSQTTFLNAETEKIKQRKIIELANVTISNQLDADQFDPGLTLAQLKGILEVYATNVVLFYAHSDSKESIATFRMHLKQVLSEFKKFILINYKSDKVGQAGGGHISPVGAYDSFSDSVLVLDVSGHLNPWVWIPVQDLYLAMHTKDGRNFRGYLIIEDKHE